MGILERFSLKGQRALVTGASRGIGRAIALRLAKDGRHVVLMSRSAAPLSDLKAEIEAKWGAGRATVRAVDVADGKALAAAVESVAEELGRLDILVNNAGITKDGLILRMSDEDWGAVIQTNLTAAFVACRSAARRTPKPPTARRGCSTARWGMFSRISTCQKRAKSCDVGYTGRHGENSFKWTVHV